MREEITAFIEAFNSGQFFEAHEILEEPWKRKEDPLYKDDGVRGLIFLAALYVHRQRANPVGVRDLAEKAERALAPRAPSVHGVDVRPVLELFATHPKDPTLPLVILQPFSGKDRI